MQCTEDCQRPLGCHDSSECVSAYGIQVRFAAGTSEPLTVSRPACTMAVL